MVSTKKPEAVGEPLYAMPSVVPALDAVRGAILILDWRWLRENALFAEYERVLSDRALLATVAFDWVPIATAMSHWRALDALSLPAAIVADVGQFVGARVHGMFLRTLLRLAGQVGTSPWVALAQSQKLWERSWRGGGLVVRRLGPSAAKVEAVSVAVAQSSFFRASLRGAVAEGIAPLCARVHVVEMEELRTPESFALRASWH